MRTLLLSLLLTAMAGAAPIVQFEGGTDDRVTERFKVEGPWTLKWDFQGAALKVFIFSDKAGPSAKPIVQAGSGAGNLDVETGGTFWLEIKSAGTYKLSVDSRQAGTLPVFQGNLERKGTSVFTAPMGWGFRWSADSVFKATLYDERRNPVGSPVVQVGPGDGERMVDTPGKYFFMIQSSGPYKIEIFKR